jgi:hypothetical protein
MSSAVGFRLGGGDRQEPVAELCWSGESLSAARGALDGAGDASFLLAARIGAARGRGQRNITVQTRCLKLCVTPSAKELFQFPNAIHDCGSYFSSQTTILFGWRVNKLNYTRNAAAYLAGV